MKTINLSEKEIDIFLEIVSTALVQVYEEIQKHEKIGKLMENTVLMLEGSDNLNEDYLNEVKQIIKDHGQLLIDAKNNNMLLTAQSILNALESAKEAYYDN